MNRPSSPVLLTALIHFDGHPQTRGSLKADKQGQCHVNVNTAVHKPAERLETDSLKAAGATLGLQDLRGLCQPPWTLTLLGVGRQRDPARHSGVHDLEGSASTTQGTACAPWVRRARVRPSLSHPSGDSSEPHCTGLSQGPGWAEPLWPPAGTSSVVHRRRAYPFPCPSPVSPSCPPE